MNLDFVCIGAQKAGTTTLHDILKNHPDICLPYLKEAQFFDINENYKKGLNVFFNTFYNNYNGEKITGNINPNLQLNDRSIDRLIESFGTNIKILFILRNPVDRAFSHYQMSKKRGYENLDFLSAVSQEQGRIDNPKLHNNYLTQELVHYEKNHLGYIYRSKYLEKIKYLHSKFDSKNLKFILFEDFVNNKELVVKEILEFLELPMYKNISLEVKSNVASKPKSLILRNILYKHSIFKKSLGFFLSVKIKERIKAKLDSLNSKPLTKDEKTISTEDRIFIYQKFFQSELIQLEKLLNRSLDHWKPL